MNLEEFMPKNEMYETPTKRFHRLMEELDRQMKRDDFIVVLIIAPLFIFLGAFIVLSFFWTDKVYSILMKISDLL